MKKPQKAQVLALLAAGWLRTLLLALLLVLLAQVLAKSLWMLVAGPLDPVPASGSLPMLATARNSAPQASLDATQVAAWALFGEAKLAQSASSEVKNAPETRLNLTLVGVFAHGDSEMSGAIIATSGGDAKLYHPGDELPGRATLYKVYPDRVLLKRMGVTEALSLEQGRLNGHIAATTTTPEPAAPTGFAAPDSLMQQRALVIEQLSLAPVAQGVAQGYKVTTEISKDIQNALGLQPGDLLLSVNGFPLGTKSADKAAIQSFYETGKAKVQIKRGSSRLTLTYPP